MAKFLVLGGAGYIGSHMVNYLLQNGQQVVVFDNLSTGHANAILTDDFELLDVLDLGRLHWAFNRHGPFDCVIHFCARSLVGESVQDPALYYQNNVMGTLNLLNVMRKTQHSKLIFSSTAAVFGEPKQERINEAHPCSPINPYGRSKLMVEMMLKDFTKSYGIDSVCLRYFNAAGADPQGHIGEKHEPETHLIPNVLKGILASKKAQALDVLPCVTKAHPLAGEGATCSNTEPVDSAEEASELLSRADIGRLQVMAGTKGSHVDEKKAEPPCLKVFGNDYDTPDGSCIRDYIHVNDLADAHFRAYQYLQENAGAYCFNLGNGQGFSVLDVIKAAEQVTQSKVPYEVAPRRAGDPAKLVADPSLAMDFLGWQPKYTRLEHIIQTAWDFMLLEESKGAG